MSMQDQQLEILSKIESMVCAWNKGDIVQCQNKYHEIEEFCESNNYDFTKTLTGGINLLKSKCVGVGDSMMYECYVRCEINQNSY